VVNKKIKTHLYPHLTPLYAQRSTLTPIVL
jgi:hypothetical protein